MKNFKSIPQITQARYASDIGWDYIDRWIQNHKEYSPVKIQPDFQRSHVWTEKQQIAYLEWVLRGGESGKDLHWNCPGWQTTSDIYGPLVLVDGLQRLTTVKKFLNNEIPAFGHLFKNWERLPFLGQCRFRFHIMDLDKREDILQWYLDMNSGGTDHTEKELENVRGLLKTERETENV